MSDVSTKTPKKKPIPLREWVKHALETIDVSSLATFGADSSSWPADIQRSLAVLSDAYLLTALKVAHSLADQVCRIAEEEGLGENKPRTSSLPVYGTDWAHQIVVHVANIHDRIDDYKGDLQPLPFSPQDPGPNLRELQAELNYLIQDASKFEEEDDVLEREISYHDVTKAEILPSLIEESKGSDSRTDKMYMYNLGIVFYEMFSGGEIPSGITVHKSTNKLTRMNECGTAIKAGVDGHNMPYDQAGTSFLDLGRGLSLSAELDKLKESLDEQRLPPKKKVSQKVSTMNSVSVEALKLKGLPTSLCDLIGNMIDSINGDLSGEESYSNMEDVRNDLQLLLEKPNDFLHDIDIEKVSVTGLQLNESMIGRENELLTLQTSYRASISGEYQVGIIVGPSGVGKSVLAQRLGKFASATGGLFLSGNFGQLQQPKPFSALASAFNEYCNKMAERGPNYLQGIAAQLRKAVGAEAHYLVQIIPNLSIILGEDSCQDTALQDCVNAQKRLQYLLCRFVDVMSTFSGAPVILFLDNLQYV